MEIFEVQCEFDGRTASLGSYLSRGIADDAKKMALEATPNKLKDFIKIKINTVNVHDAPLPIMTWTAVGYTLHFAPETNRCYPTVEQFPYKAMQKDMRGDVVDDLRTYGVTEEAALAVLKERYERTLVDGTFQAANPGATTQTALDVVARSVSTSYKEVMPPDVLASILRSGTVPENFRAHIMSLLDEVDLFYIGCAVRLAATADVPLVKIVGHLEQWAKEWKTHRQVFKF